MDIGFGVLELKTHPERGEMWMLSDVPPHVRIRLKEVFPKIPMSQFDNFVFPADARNAADLHWFQQRYPFKTTAREQRRLERDKRRHDALRAELDDVLVGKAAMGTWRGLKPGQKVRPYQKVAVELLVRTGGLLLGDVVGLGKTYTAAAAMLQPKMRPAVVVTPPHLSSQWVQKIEEFTTLSVHRISSTRYYSVPYHDVLIFHYTQIAGWLDTLRELNIGLVTYEEVQDLRHGDETKKGQAAQVLSRLARARLGISATPIYNWGREMYNVLGYINDEVLGTEREFVREWCPSGRIDDPEALGAYLRYEKVFLRRTKADVGQQMPPINRIREQIDQDSEEISSVRELAQGLAQKAKTGSFEERGQAMRELDARVRQATGISKAKYVAAFVRMIVESGQKVLLTGWHRAVYDIWLKELDGLNPVMYTGSEGDKQKRQSVDDFVNGDANVFIMSMRSGAGLDGLQHVCSNVVFGELDWSQAIHDQIIGRLDREGQKEPVTAFFLTAEEGSDPPMVELLALKASETSAIIDPDEDRSEPVHSDRSHLMRLVEQYL